MNLLRQAPVGAESAGDPFQRDRAAARAFALWLAFSLLLHGVILLWAPRPHLPDSMEPSVPPLTVELRPQQPPEPPPAAAPPPPVAVTPPPTPRPRQPPRPATKAPPVIALDKPKAAEPPFKVPQPKPEETPAPVAPPPVAQSTPPAAPPTLAPAEPDLAAYVEARRRARGEIPDAGAAEAERANRNAMSSAALNQSVANALTPPKPRNGYGSFEIRRRGFDYAEFMFKGWNENFRRNGLELIEVRQGNNPSIDLAVIRSIISVIRRTETGDFTWVSHRLGRSITLSARPRDNAGLEEFMMQEFYEDLHRYR